MFVEVGVYHPWSAEEKERSEDFRLLVDEGVLVVHDERDFKGMNFGPDSDGRHCLKLTNYRVTAHGLKETQAWWEKGFANVAGNIPTIVVSVVSALLICWLSNGLGFTK
jgi:hypothetical protein